MAGCSEEAKAKLTAAFREVDKDNSGTIDTQEIINVLTSFYSSSGKTPDPKEVKKDAEDFIREVDKDNDNKISLKEFLNYFGKYCK